MTSCELQVQFRPCLPLTAEVFYILLVRDETFIMQHGKTHVYSLG